ncbi:MAG: hypothetical protein GZ088_15930 [Acidipila sp.]|nr:hypothetical protein [Acidipila sp.]
MVSSVNEIPGEAVVHEDMRGILRAIVRGTYDLQKLRIQIGNRIVGNFRIKLGQRPGKPASEELDADGKKIIETFKEDYKKMMDGLLGTISYKKFRASGVISSYAEFTLLEQYMALEKQEEVGFGRLGSILTGYPIFTQFLSGVLGCGPRMSGVIISEFNPEDYYWTADKNGVIKNRVSPEAEGAKKHTLSPSSFWKYAGLAVMPDGLGQSRLAEHLIDLKYYDAKNKVTERKSITFNPWLKTKLIGVLAPSFIKAGVRWQPCSTEQYDAAPTYKRSLKMKKDPEGGKAKLTKCLLVILSPYAEKYMDYRWRLDVHPKYRDFTEAEIMKMRAEKKGTVLAAEADLPPPEDEPSLESITADEDTVEEDTNVLRENKGRKGHRHAMAMRYMVKMFLIDLYVAWRKIEGLEVRPPYSQDKLGLDPH